MTRVLILGGAGMLGHKLAQTLAPRFETVVTFRDHVPRAAKEAFAGCEIRENVEVVDFDVVTRVVAAVRPAAIVNCVGIVKQLPAANDPVPSLQINALLPHRLHALARAAGARLVHLSTDCVFSGRKGNYVESDEPDPIDLYGRSKLLGEVEGGGAVTLRTSIIGRQIRGTTGLVEWFLSNRGGSVDGWSRALYSGLTSAELAAVIANVLERPSLAGLYHVSGEPISKLELLHLVNDVFRAGVSIRQADAMAIDRTLDSARFRAATGWKPRPWREMIEAMASDPTPYEDWRRSR